MTLEDVDRTIYELIRLKVVAAGLLPDITNYATAQDYNDAKEALAATTKYNQIVEVIGVGAMNARDEKRTCRIVIDRKSIVQGEIGSYGVTEFDRNVDGQTFTKSRRDSTTYDLQYDIRCISNSAHYDRILNGIVLQTFSLVSYQSIVDGTGFGEDQLLITQVDSRNVTSSDLLEYLYTYQASDVYLLDNTVVKDDIQQIIDVDGSIEPTLDLETLPEVDTNDPEVDVQQP